MTPLMNRVQPVTRRTGHERHFPAAACHLQDRSVIEWIWQAHHKHLRETCHCHLSGITVLSLRLCSEPALSLSKGQALIKPEGDLAKSAERFQKN